MHRIKIILIICSFVFLLPTAQAQKISWRLMTHNDARVLELELGDHLFSLTASNFQVFVGEHQEWPGEKMSSMLGDIIEYKGRFLFKPTFPFRQELLYTAFCNKLQAFTFSIPFTASTTSLLAIYPSEKYLPANLLKIYLHFSAPMGEGKAYEHLSLINLTGDTIHQPFVPLEPELWTTNRKRLTLWLDPGRVKRGLLSHEAHGVVLEQGESYTLIVHPAWKDAAGKRLGKAYRKDFQVIVPDYQKLQVANWEYQFPNGGTIEPLGIVFDEALDQALLDRSISVRLASGPTIAGKTVLKNKESEWYFYPEVPWREGEYTIQIDSKLEDLAGNNLNRPFDREITTGEKQIVPQDFFTINFKIKTSK